MSTRRGACADELCYAVSGLIDADMAEACPQAIVDALPQYPAEEVREAYGELYELKGLPAVCGVTTISMSAATYRSARRSRRFACMSRMTATPGANTALHPLAISAVGRKIDAAGDCEKGDRFWIARSGKRHNIEVDFFGGEPLMAWDTVVQTVDYARSLEEKHGKKFRFTITTTVCCLMRTSRRISTRIWITSCSH